MIRLVMGKVKSPEIFPHYPRQIGLRLHKADYQRLVELQQPYESLTQTARRLMLAGVAAVTQPEKQPEITA